ncbi:MAG: hypothetical protein KME26_31450 [Oscillatoria princeps RMCB-10]|nr:hypothetical protein [Oscillatoria princeps RMCB-10]
MSKPPAAAGGNSTHNPLGQRQPSEKRMCHRRATGGVFEQATGGSLPVGEWLQERSASEGKQLRLAPACPNSTSPSCAQRSADRNRHGTTRHSG